jgi:hypothetical protein
MKVPRGGCSSGRSTGRRQHGADDDCDRIGHGTNPGEGQGQENRPLGPGQDFLENPGSSAQSSALSSPASAIQATETTSSPSAVSNTLTPPALRERNEMPATGTRIDCPVEVASMI